MDFYLYYINKNSDKIIVEHHVSTEYNDECIFDELKHLMQSVEINEEGCHILMKEHV